LIGGGIKSLYEAYPEALKQIDLGQLKELIERALSFVNEDEEAIESTLSDNNDSKHNGDGATATISSTMVRDDHNDAMTVVQQEHVQCDEVVTSMWVHEEDAGVQMLGCSNARMICRILDRCSNEIENLRTSVGRGSGCEGHEGATQ
jgi:hypothetical protein